MATAYLNRIATAVPPHEVHRALVESQRRRLSDPRRQAFFDRLVEFGQIERRWSFLTPADGCRSASIDGRRFYSYEDNPSTGERMRQYERKAPELAAEAVTKLDLGGEAKRLTHLVVTSCTGFSAPGIDLELVRRLGLDPSIERTIIGFMGCYAAINALKAARHIVRSEPQARVLVVSIELCTLHFQNADKIEDMTPLLIFADGCAAALVSSEPAGFALEGFYAALLPEAWDQMAWNIGDHGFDMVLSSRIPAHVGRALRTAQRQILRGAEPGEFELWAVHPGGKSVLDAVEAAFELSPRALNASRKVLREFGNMSSATVLFVLRALLAEASRGARGCAMSFGPGLTAETMLFRAAG